VKQGFGFVDNRTEVVSQRILKETMNNGLRILQRQQFGEQKVNYITNGQAPIAGTLDFNSVNTKNEKYGTRAEAFKRAKDLAGASTADRTFDYHANPAGNEEGKRVQIVPAANPQRDGRYYDFLNGNLIAEHTSDNQAIITIGGMPQNTVPHFHVASYQGDRYMDLGNLGGDGIRRNQNVPPQYNILYGGHHIYY